MNVPYPLPASVQVEYGRLFLKVSLTVQNTL